MATFKGLNAHERPPDPVREVYKRYRRTDLPEIDQNEEIIDLEKIDVDDLPRALTISGFLSSKELRMAFDEFVHKSEGNSPGPSNHGGGLIEDIPIFTHAKVSGKAFDDV